MSTMGLLEDAFVYGKGWEEIILGAQPGAGANFQLKLDSRWETRVICAIATLVTSASAANRYLTLTYDNGNGLVYNVCGAGLVVTANTTQRFVWQLNRGVAEWATGTDVFVPLQDMFLEGGHNLNLNVGAIQAADQLSGISFVVQRFATGPRGYVEGDVAPRARGRRR